LTRESEEGKFNSWGKNLETGQFNSKTRAPGDFCMHHLFWMSPADSAERRKAHIQICTNLNPAIIRENGGPCEK